MTSLSEAQLQSGVATCSAGNHGKGVAYAARQLGVPATIYVPANVDIAKHRAMMALGAQVIRSDYAGFDQTHPLEGDAHTASPT